MFIIIHNLSHIKTHLESPSIFSSNYSNTESPPILFYAFKNTFLVLELQVIIKVTLLAASMMSSFDLFTIVIDQAISFFVVSKFF